MAYNLNNNTKDNRHSFKMSVLVVSLILSFIAILLTCGCSSESAIEPQEQPASASDYMVSLNDCSTRLSQKLQEFSDAASEQRISAMNSNAEEAYEILDEMSSLEAPDDVSDLKNKYNDAASKLKDALSEYIALYVEIYDSSQSSSAQFDYSTYTERLQSIQQQYDDALNALEEADKMATEM